MVKEISSEGEFNSEIKVPNLVVVDFYATWCGPCKMIAPFIEQLSSKYPDVKFLKVAEHNCQNLIMSLGVRAFPTFQFYVNGNKVDELKGADPRQLEAKVNQHKPAASFGGSGTKLGASAAPAWDGVGMPPGPGNARDARLKAFGSIDAKPKKDPTKPAAPSPSTSSRAPSTSSSVPTPMVTEDDEEEALAMALALSKGETPTATPSSSSSSAPPSHSESDRQKQSQGDKDDQAEAEAAFAAEMQKEKDNDGWEEEMVPVPVDEGILTELIEMGFTDVRARKGIVHGKSLEGALGWLTEHLEDPDIDQPYMVRKRDTIPKIPLTEEEKAEKMAALKLKAKQRREQREKDEKAEKLKKEKERRERGQTMDVVQEERERLQRKRDADKAKKEKEDAKRERERLRAEIARDKEIRAKNKGVLPSVLGVEGYNPSILQQTPTSSTGGSKSSGESKIESKIDSKSESKRIVEKSKEGSKGTEEMDIETAERTVDSSISTMMRYRTGGDGGAALKLLNTMVKNVANAPEEVKYRSINMETKAFKSKFGNILGPLPLLKALGFEKVESEGGSKLQLDKVNLPLFQSTVNKLTLAEETYAKMNA
mmetsp:Transcript_28442/g.28758  ORF Transcript_28442/g.28758 Transcript_28442/m.28758 type:complete len:596 (+) Transcript_28442:167-1954(+)|eukprot:CAMPEP_0182427672 /NCGR_PEP_ID=MMETSP1167-20130531/18966_1 /TAXON_ID=2988 /ORGANISM="Mallomonas Sp, Strain CCMP3275" /LENGTH=595 /DNA_ID=CAMNT_0024610083 /DNA_START=163 /DNA_END=1950 /DNA_ORIENTATION=-